MCQPMPFLPQDLAVELVYGQALTLGGHCKLHVQPPYISTAPGAIPEVLVTNLHTTATGGALQPAVSIVSLHECVCCNH